MAHAHTPESADEAIQELEHAIACLRTAKAYTTPGAIKTALRFASTATECAQLVIAGAVEGL
jgi:hypothetical protein